MLCRTSSELKPQQIQMRKSFVRLRAAKPWKILSKKAVEIQLEMFRDRSTSLCEDSGPLRDWLTLVLPFVFAISYGKSILGLCWWSRVQRWELPQDWGLRQTQVWHPHIAAVSPVPSDMSILLHLPWPASRLSFVPPKYLLLPIPASPDEALSIRIFP